MKKFLRIFVVAGCLFFFATAQVKSQRLVFLFGHLAYNIPSESSFKDNYNFGLGGEAGAGIGWNKTFITGTVGINFFNSTGNNQLGNAIVYPVKFGLRQYLVGKMVYLHADAGVSTVKYKNVDANGCFSADAGIGAKLLGLEVQLDYDGFSRPYASGYSSWIGIKAGYSFGL